MTSSRCILCTTDQLLEILIFTEHTQVKLVVTRLRMDSNSSALITNCKNDTFLNLSDPEKAQIYLFTPSDDLFFTWILPAVLFICLFGNSAFIFTVVRVPSMRTVTNNYLLHVAILDIIFVTVSVGNVLYAWLTSPISVDVPYRSFVGCMLTFHSVYTTYFASILLITFVTVERYYAICKPLQHRAVAGKSRTNRIIVASWITGVLLAACVTPRYSGFMMTQCVEWPDSEEFKHLPTTINNCSAVHPDTLLISTMLHLVLLFLVMLINIFMYISIIRALGQRPTLGNTLDNVANQVQQRQSQRVRNQVARLLIINGTIFFLCQSPARFSSLHTLMVQITGSGIITDPQYGTLLSIGRFLVFINSCVNPFIYVATSSVYREAFLEAIGCRP